MQTPFDLERFVAAQAPLYDKVCDELRAGRKRSHWMWFIFPQVAGLGRSAMAQKYAIASLAEAQAYLAHPQRGPRLRDCRGLVAASEASSADAVFPYPDNLKVHSSMTLFAHAAPGETVFRACLDKFFGGAADAATLELLQPG